jgi:hypothetical protein
MIGFRDQRRGKLGCDKFAEAAADSGRTVTSSPRTAMIRARVPVAIA